MADVKQFPSKPRDHFQGGPAGSGGGEPPVEARIARLESDVEFIKRDIGEIKTDVRELRREVREDFRVLAGIITFVALGLAGLMARGFHWL